MGGSAYPRAIEKPSVDPDSVMAQASDVSETASANLSNIVLQFSDRTLLDTLTQLSLPSESIRGATLEFLSLLRKLRSPEQGWQLHHPPTPDGLLPYVSDEAQDILEALQGSARNSTNTFEPASALVRLETLSPKLLWCVARSSYPTMQLLEGLPARVCAPDGEWQPGILRLGVIVELRNSRKGLAIDLALGAQPHPALNSDWLIQLDQDSDFQPGWDTRFEDESERSLFWLKRSLSSITHQLMVTQPTLQTWLDGIPVDWLIPGHRWQSGVLKLKVEIGFMPQVSVPFTPIAARVDPIEAELLDDLDMQSLSTTESGSLDSPSATLPITVVDMPLSPAIATTIIRLASPALQEEFTQFAIEQELIQLINSFCVKAKTDSVDELLLPFVQDTYHLIENSPSLARSSFCLVQPELLIDELLPKLLWHVTRSSFAGMEWLGGLPCTLLQPDANWRMGMLRLMVILDVQTQENQWWIDLTTGRFLPDRDFQLPIGTIAQLHKSASLDPVAVDQLKVELQRAIYAVSPELACLGNGVEVEWLTVEHDWQPGQLQLHLSFEFTPDLF